MIILCIINGIYYKILNGRQLVSKKKKKKAFLYMNVNNIMEI